MGSSREQRVAEFLKQYPEHRWVAELAVECLNREAFENDDVHPETFYSEYYTGALEVLQGKWSKSSIADAIAVIIKEREEQRRINVKLNKRNIELTAEIADLTLRLLEGATLNCYAEHV